MAHLLSGITDFDKLQPPDTASLGVPLVGGLLQYDAINWRDKARLAVVTDSRDITVVREDGGSIAIEQVFHEKETLREIGRRRLIAGSIMGLVFTYGGTPGHWQAEALGDDILRVMEPEPFRAFVKLIAEGAAHKLGKN
jgi:hypothetical protein